MNRASRGNRGTKYINYVNLLRVMELSVIIPAYNEENRIKRTLEYTSSFLDTRGYDYEIIVVDDGSKDNTRDVVESLNNNRIKLTNKRENKGKGYSVKQGMLLADKSHILFMDADNSTKIDEIANFWKHTNQYDILIGSRNLNESKIPIKQPFIRSTLGKIFPLFVRLFVIRGVKDTQCGFKFFTRDSAQKILRYQKSQGFAFDVELLFLAKKFGYDIKEMPITWHNDEDSKVKFLTPLKMLMSLFKIRLNNLKGAYDEDMG